MESHLHSCSTLIKPNCHHLVLRRDTQSSQDVRIYLRKSGTEKELVEVLLSVGCPLFVITISQFFQYSLVSCFQVDETEEDKGKLDSVTFKRIVWHQSFQRLLESIKLHSWTGCSVVCGDGIERLLFPFILILSADYEEQYVISIF